jgi:cyanophycin synthetase
VSTDEVRVLAMRALRTHNVHAYVPVLQVDLAVGRFDDLASCDVPGVDERLLAWLPELADHECSVGRPGGFVERLRRGTYLPHIVEHVTLALQERVGARVGFGRARGTGEPGVYRIVVEIEEEAVGRAAFEAALQLARHALEPCGLDVDDLIERLHETADDHRLGPTTSAIVAAARRLGIPTTRLTPTSSLVQLGYGVHQRRIQASQTSLTSALAVDACQEKPLTNRLLRNVGVPVPEGRTAQSADEAWEVARDVGLPVVVKPHAGNQGRGVSVDLRDEAQVRRAYEVAADFGRTVLVEEHAVGADFRLLVVDGQLIAAARRDPAHVLGDGVRSVEQLVAALNRDPRRRPGHCAPLSRVRLDGAVDLVLAQQGLTRISVPAAGQRVLLRTNANLSTGGTATDVTDEVHPDNARLAELAAEIIGLDIAGIDVIARTLARPLSEQGGKVIEVNAAPGLRMHLAPAVGRPRDVGTPIVRMLYPAGTPGRIPIVAVTGTNGKTTVTRLVAHLLETARFVVGRTSTEGAWIGRERILSGDCSGPRSAEAVLLHPRVEAAVLETARGGILREGLAFDRCTVGVVTNVSADHLGLAGVHSLEQLARVKQVVVQAVGREGAAVLNAEDPLVAEMAASCVGRVIYFARSARHPVVAAHVEAGHAAVYVHEGAIVLHGRLGPQVLVELARVPFTFGGQIGFQVANALAGVAAAWAVGTNPALIARGLSTFATDPSTVPGRFNVLARGEVQVVVDYAHNLAAVSALGEGLRALGTRRTLLVGGLPGDRRDEDLRATIRATRTFVDAWYLHDLADRRGRAPGEVTRLLCDALGPDADCSTYESARRAVERALADARPGERVVVIADEVEELLELLPEHDVGPATERDLEPA